MTTITDRPPKRATSYYRKLAATRGARWKRIERDYHQWKDQDRADRMQDETIRRRAWDAYRGELPSYRWRTGLQHKFRHSFGEGDYTSIPDFDTLAREMAGEFPGMFGYAAGYDEESTDDHSRLLFDYLAAPPLKRRPAHDVLMELIERHARREPAPDTGFDPEALDDEPDRLALARQNRPATEKRRKQPPAIGYVELPTPIGVLCLTSQQALDPAKGGTAEQRDGSQHVQLIPTNEPDVVHALATNGKAIAVVQCQGRIDQPRMIPGPLAPRKGAKPGKPAILALNDDRWLNGEGAHCGRVNEELVTFPGLNTRVDNRSEPFALDIEDIVKLGKALGSKRLAFYVPPGDAFEEPKVVAVMPLDATAAIGYGMLITQPGFLPSGEQFADAVQRVLGVELPPAEEAKPEPPISPAPAPKAPERIRGGVGAGWIES